MKIYLIDDDELSNFVSAKTIEKSGISCEIVSFTHARTALNALIEVQKKDPSAAPDVIFLDINMPEVNGWEFLDEYCKNDFHQHKRILIFLLTSSLYQKDIEKGKSYTEIVDYIPKPLNITLLKELKTKYFQIV